MSKVLFLQGLPASGKSTWSKEFCEKNTDWIRICRDDLRRMRGQYWIPKQEDLISQFEKNCIISALFRGYNVVVDSTNLNPLRMNKLKTEISKYYPATIFETKIFNVSVEECIKRDLVRPNSVGAEVIKKFAELLKPKEEKVNQDKSLPSIILVDLDGTIALHNGRSAYDYDKCDTDLPNEPIIKIIENYLSYGNGNVIFMSGREDRCFDKTKAWIKKYIQIKDDEFKLYMRKTGDRRKDCIVKRELFDYNIRDNYYVEFILDDRSQVVSMWRDLGLTCLQVAPGDF